MSEGQAIPVADIQRMDIKEFRDRGYLMEVNRQFLHPLGLALSVIRHDDGHWSLGDIWDYRDDPEGMIFADEVWESGDTAKAAAIAQERAAKEIVRREHFGWTVQPIPSVEASET